MLFQFSCANRVENKQQKENIMEIYRNNLHKKYSSPNSIYMYVFSGNFPFETSAEPKRIYVAKIDSNENIVYELRPRESPWYIDSIRITKYPYYLNIPTDGLTKSYFISEFLIDENTNISDLENIYLKYKDKESKLCCDTKKKDWKYYGYQDIYIDSCQLIIP